MNGTDALAEFRATRAEAAFSELVRRYTNLVYSIGKRRVLDNILAQEVTQIVFIRLAKSPPKLNSEAQLLTWLHRTAVHVSIDLWRSETRRRAREHHAMSMNNNPSEEVAWKEISPILDEALDELNDADRQAILLRFFEQKTMADLGRMFGVTEDAAKMRVSRALEKLRRRFGGMRATCSAALLGTLLAERSVEASPPTLASMLAAIRTSAPIGLAGVIANLLGQASKLKLLSGLAIAILVGGATLFLIKPARRSADSGTLFQADAGLGQEGSPENQSLQTGSAETKTEPSNPNPIKLLQGVVRARQRIASGIIDFDVFTVGNVTRPDATNWLQLKIRFEDGRCWAESKGREFSYVTPIPGGPEAEIIVKRADQMPREESVREGLLKPFPSHHVSYYDGNALIDYWETDSSHPRTVIDEPGRSGVFIFDPRLLGFSTSLQVENKVETCLPYKEAKAITLSGKEITEGSPTWHVQIHSQYDSTFDIWIDALYPTRVLKLQFNDEVALSRYSDTDLKDPLPVEVRNISYRSGISRYETRLVRLHTQYNVPTDTTCWTLDGLHMKIGTDVSDNRSHRRIGYWTGTGLSDNLPRADRTPLETPNRAQLLMLLDIEPATQPAFAAAQWILTNSPDGADVQKAAEVILHEHIQSPDLVKLTQELERMRPSCSSNLLQAMMEQNPSPEVRGNACLALATIRKDAADYGRNKQATAEAEKLFERVIAEFGRVKQRGYALAELARPQLLELRRLTLGKVAPEIEGYDLYGRPMKLSNYRGQVVALLFWSALCPMEQESREFRRLVEQMQGKSFVLLGIHADDPTEKAKAAAEKYEMSWPSFQDARQGPISTNYNINSWPTVYVLDRKGVIRYRNLYHRSEIAAAVDKLLEE
jgi:RNA polymerase sigma factor (sigma-70 family)